MHLKTPSPPQQQIQTHYEIYACQVHVGDSRIALYIRDFSSSKGVLQSWPLIVLYSQVPPLVVILYNHLLTLDTEVRLVWGAQTNCAKVLLLFVSISTISFGDWAFIHQPIFLDAICIPGTIRTYFYC